MTKKDLDKGEVSVSATALIENEEHKILLIWEGDTPYHKCWVMPGGYVKQNETVEQAVVREVREETGIEILPLKLIGIYDDFITNEEDRLMHHIIVGYAAKIIAGELTITLEATEYAWMDVKEALKSARTPHVFKRIVGDFRKLRRRHLLDLFSHKVS